jgi:hypothetical protein
MAQNSNMEKALVDLARSAGKLVTLFTAMHEANVAWCKETRGWREELLGEMVKGNAPFEEDEVEEKIQKLREFTDAARDLTAVVDEATAAFPTEPTWNIGDKVRVLERSSPWYGHIGTIIGKNLRIEVEFDETFEGSDGKIHNRVSNFSPINLHHMDAHLKPVVLGPEWQVDNYVRVTDKHTIMFHRIGRITAVNPTTVDVYFQAPEGRGDTGAEFHPSQLEIVLKSDDEWITGPVDETHIKHVCGPWCSKHGASVNKLVQQIAENPGQQRYMLGEDPAESDAIQSSYAPKGMENLPGLVSGANGKHESDCEDRECAGCQKGFKFIDQHDDSRD